MHRWKSCACHNGITCPHMGSTCPHMGITCSQHGYHMFTTWVSHALTWVSHVHNMDITCLSHDSLPATAQTITYQSPVFVLLHTCKLSSKIYILHCKECTQSYKFWSKKKKKTCHVELLLVFIYIQYRIIMYTINYVKYPTSTVKNCICFSNTKHILPLADICNILTTAY